MRNMIYTDNAATTRIKDRVLNKMQPYLNEEYGNPSSLYAFSQSAKRAVEEAREKVAKLLGADTKEIYFTGCGTEADNWAIKGAAWANEKRGKHIITTKIEHHAVLHTCEYLEKRGFEVTYLDVDKDGFISIDALKSAIRDDTVLITVMYANNEIGTIMPISEIGKIARERKILFHTDAVQAVGHTPIDVHSMNIDMLSLSGHKLGAPKGVGALYIRKGVVIDSLLHGGGHERGKRAGTENVPHIVGLGEAAEISLSEMAKNIKEVSAMRDKLIDGVLKMPYTHLTGPRDNRLPGIASFIIEGIEGEALLLKLFEHGICSSSGSACSSGSLDPSHVLLAIGKPHHIAHGSLRLSISEDNTDEEIGRILEALPKVVKELRDMSPVWEDGKPAWTEM